MAKLYIVEFDRATLDARGGEVMSPKYPPVAKQAAMNIGMTSTQSAAFSSGTRYIQIHTDAICSIDIGANPTADASYDRVGAGERLFVGVEPNHKLAVITNT